MLKLYDFPLSGHAHRARLLLSLLKVPYERIDVNLRQGQHKTAEFLKLNFLGQVPVLVDGDVVVRDSNGAYPHVRAWLKRIEALPGFVAMPAAFPQSNRAA